jgi:predicted metal-dependent HD superfamily phosphohydrolase
MHRLGVDPSPAAAELADLVRAYSEPGRYYHTLGHVAQVLATLAEHGRRADNPAALELAAWYHDVVYDSRAADNEERSADHAGRVLGRLGLDPALIAAVQGLIRDTKTHRPSGDAADSRLFLDADLAVLGAPEAEYNSYARAIRQEYAWVPEPVYRVRRQDVLRRFLGRPRIYLTDALFAEREQRARSNLAKEIRSLDGPA